MNANGKALTMIVGLIALAAVAAVIVTAIVNANRNRDGEKNAAEIAAARKAERRERERADALQTDKDRLERDLTAARTDATEISRQGAVQEKAAEREAAERDAAEKKALAIEQMRVALKATVDVQRVKHFDRPRRSDDGRYRIIAHNETVWLKIGVANTLPSGLQIKYQLYERAAGIKTARTGPSGTLTQPVTRARYSDVFNTPFARYEWEAREDRAAALLTGARYDGYRVEFWWRGTLIKTMSENAPTEASLATR